MEIIKINNLTKDYGNGKGIFDVTFTIKKGEIFGFLGPNGAGKTTTIRHLLGFIIPKEKKCIINGLDCNKDIDLIQKKIGYIPGEINLMEEISGIQFIKFMADYRGMKNLGRANELIKRFELDPRCKIKKMSKGMKQKVGIVIAFMHDPDILILDEPTSGLDPIVRSEILDIFRKYIEEDEKRSILLSTHITTDLEHISDYIIFIDNGKMLFNLPTSDLLENYAIVKCNEIDFKKIKKEDYISYKKEKYQYEILIDNRYKFSKKYDVSTIDKASIEDIMLFYIKGDK